MKQPEMNEAFMYKVIDYVDGVYKLQNVKTGRVITMAKDEFDRRLAEQQKAAVVVEEM